MNPELIKGTQDFLFASEEEMQKAHVPTDVRQRLLRLRDMYSYWLRNPKLGDRHILAEIKRRNGLADTQAYEDLRLLKLCLGNLQQMTRDWYQYLFITRCEEGFQMARDKGDAGAFAKVLASLGKFTRLDHEQLAGPDYSQIIPQQFELTSDPTVSIILPAQSQALVHEPMPWQEIPIVGLAEVETTEEVENGTRLTTTKLTATLCRHFQIPTTPTAFRLTNTRGNTYLLGTSEHPYPLITQAQNHAARPSERTAFTLTIEHTSENSLVEIRA